MVVKRRLLLAIPLALTLSLVATASPTLGAFSAARPDPLSRSGIVRVHDIAVVRNTGGEGPVVAVGWREARKPGQLYLTFSLNGGRSYRRANGSFRKFPVLGNGDKGISVDICGGRVWAASIVGYPGDDRGDSDVLLTSRAVRGGAGQAFVTNATYDRTTHAVSLACVGNRLLAIAWLETAAGSTRARLQLRSLEPLGQRPEVRRVLPLGPAQRGGGISLDASNTAVHVAWTADDARNLHYKRFLIGRGADPRVAKRPTRELASGDIRYPQLGLRGNNIVLAYTDVGQVKARISRDGGAQFSDEELIVGTGGMRRPSRAYSVDISAERIVIEALASRRGEHTPQRIQSDDGGQSWDRRSFGNVGVRVGALRKTSATRSLLVEAWQNNASGTDSLRAQYEH
jgi:hypothetical protein